MIAYIKGKVKSYNLETLILETNQIGYEIAYSHMDEVKLDEELEIYLFMQVSENDVSLYGFSSLEERELFKRLKSVKGMGAKTAMKVIMSRGYDQVMGDIEAGNVDNLKKIPGIGDKTARQIVLDLKGKLVEATSTKNTAKEYPQEIKEAVEALKNYGFKKAELDKAANIMLESPGLSTEEYFGIGLRALNK